MLLAFSPIFAADTKIIFNYNFRAPLKPDYLVTDEVRLRQT